MAPTPAKSELAIHNSTNGLTHPSASFDWWTAMKEQAQVMIKSRFLPPTIQTAEQCMAVAMTGKELGIGFMEAIRSINVIQGRPTISPQLMLALANRTKELEEIEITSDDHGTTVMVKRKGRKAHTESFGVKEATALQLIGKDNYKKQAKTMYKWRAIAANLRITFPDVVLGLYTPEEMGVEVQVTDGEGMEIVPKTALTQQPARAPQSESPRVNAPAALPKMEVLAEDAVVVETDPAQMKEARITPADWKAIESLRKDNGMTADALAFQLKQMGYARGSDLPQSRLFELRQWIKGDVK